MPPSENKNRVELHQLILILEEFRKLNLEMPIQHALTFLRIAEEAGETVTDVGKRAGVTLGSVSRHVEALGPVRVEQKSALDLVSSEYHRLDRRRKVLTLTKNGEALVERLVAILKKDR